LNEFNDNYLNEFNDIYLKEFDAIYLWGLLWNYIYRILQIKVVIQPHFEQ
jgi:hypothetical protein